MASKKSVNFMTGRKRNKENSRVVTNALPAIGQTTSQSTSTGTGVGQGRGQGGTKQS